MLRLGSCLCTPGYCSLAIAPDPSNSDDPPLSNDAFLLGQPTFDAMILFYLLFTFCFQLIYGSILFLFFKCTLKHMKPLRIPMKRRSCSRLIKKPMKYSSNSAMNGVKPVTRLTGFTANIFLLVGIRFIILSHSSFS